MERLPSGSVGARRKLSRHHRSAVRPVGRISPRCVPSIRLRRVRENRHRRSIASSRVRPRTGAVLGRVLPAFLRLSRCENFTRDG